MRPPRRRRAPALDEQDDDVATRRLVRALRALPWRWSSWPPDLGERPAALAMIDELEAGLDGRAGEWANELAAMRDEVDGP